MVKRMVRGVYSGKSDSLVLRFTKRLGNCCDQSFDKKYPKTYWSYKTTQKARSKLNKLKTFLYLFDPKKGSFSAFVVCHFSKQGQRSLYSNW